LAAARAMDLNDFDQPVKYRRTDTLLCPLQVLTYRRPVARVTARQAMLELSRRLLISQSHARQRRVLPPQDKSSLGRAEPATEDVVECVEIVSPFGAGNRYMADHSVELLQCGEVEPVNLVHILIVLHAPPSAPPNTRRILWIFYCLARLLEAIVSTAESRQR